LREWKSFFIAIAIIAVTSLILKFSWWNRLDESAKIEDLYRPPDLAVANETELGLARTER